MSNRTRVCACKARGRGDVLPCACVIALGIVAKDSLQGNIEYRDLLERAVVYVAPIAWSAFDLTSH